MLSNPSNAANQGLFVGSKLVHSGQLSVQPPNSLIRRLNLFAPHWPWRQVTGDTCYVADLAGAFMVQVLHQTVILYGHDQDGPLNSWFITPEGGGLAAALQACRADVSQRISDLYRILG
jgi:hypothetical protein